MTHRTLRYHDIKPTKPTRPAITRPACFGKHYDMHAVECKIECAHKASCAYAFSNSGVASQHVASPPSRGTTQGVEALADEPLPEIMEVEAPNETFWSKLGYNMGLQALTAFIREGLFAAQSVPRKKYFDRKEE